MSEESTSADLVEFTRRSVAAANRGDFDALLRGYAPDVVWDLNPLGGLGTFEGHPAIRGFLEDWHANYEELEIAPEEILDLGNGVVFAAGRQNARPAHSTGYVQMHHGNVGVWVEGLLVRITHYNDIDEARAAAERLAEERAQADA